MARVLITGAAGFVGRFAVREFLTQGWQVTAAAREIPAGGEPGALWEAVGDIAATPAWDRVVQGVECIVHAAARVHVLREAKGDALPRFRQVNVGPTVRLALAAANAGVKRFVFLSTIGVNGVRTHGCPFRETDKPDPRTAYAVSKWEAEQALLEVCRSRGVELVIVRPPLVYGPGAPGNFARLAGWVRKGWPLPVASVRNRRSLLYVKNLANALVCLAGHEKAAGELFLVADGEVVSTARLVELIAEACAVRARVWPVPEGLLRALDRAAMGSLPIAALIDSLEIDTLKIRTALSWTPPVDLSDGLRATFIHGG